MNYEKNTEEVKNTCCICGNEFEGYGNNPRPLSVKTEDDVCCNRCNVEVVLPMRLKLFIGK
jgi:uncharacterized membrane protein